MPQDLDKNPTTARYAWALLLTLVLGAILWWVLVTSQARAQGFEQILVADHYLDPNGELWIRLENTALEDAYITRMDAGHARVFPALRIRFATVSDWVMVNNTGITGQIEETYELPLSIVYSLPHSGVQDRRSEGLLRGQLTHTKPT